MAAPSAASSASFSRRAEAGKANTTTCGEVVLMAVLLAAGERAERNHQIVRRCLAHGSHPGSRPHERGHRGIEWMRVCRAGYSWGDERRDEAPARTLDRRPP